MVFFFADWRPRRSVLFVPASNARAIAKSASLRADALIFDLEDSVAPSERQAARGGLANLPASKSERVIRIHRPGDEAFVEDIAAALTTAPDAILVPKVEAAADLAAVRTAVASAAPGLPLWAMIETPLALLNLAEIVAVPGLACLVLGPNDLAKSTGVAMRPGRAAFVPWFMSAIAAARARNLCVLDGVFNAFRDVEGFAAECAHAAELGFDGKTLIHPSQIEPANCVFSPSPEEFDRARAIRATFARPENFDRGVISLDGEMIERLHLEQAERLLAAEERLRR
jgi:citrate lyase subunit beta/citryl-CoA lyase